MWCCRSSESEARAAAAEHRATAHVDRTVRRGLHASIIKDHARDGHPLAPVLKATRVEASQPSWLQWRSERIRAGNLGSADDSSSASGGGARLRAQLATAPLSCRPPSTTTTALHSLVAAALTPNRAPTSKPRRVCRCTVTESGLCLSRCEGHRCREARERCG